MTKVKTLDDLRQLKMQMQSKIALREDADQPDKMVQIKVSMATCGIASGAKEIMSCIIEELEHKAIHGVVTQTGCMGYCYAEPTIEVTIPGEKPVVYGFVTKQKVHDIVTKHIIGGQMVDGIIPDAYQTID